jgi:hypothetical protein
VCPRRLGHHASVEPAFVLHLPPDTARLAFGPPYDPHGDGYIRRFDVELTDAGLTATTTTTIGVFGSVELDAFLYGLADEWRGWDGVRSWRSMEGELLIDATHDRTRRVSLDVTVQPPQTLGAPSWSARCLFEVEPGAQLVEIANQIATLLGPPATRYRPGRPGQPRAEDTLR